MAQQAPLVLVIGDDPATRRLLHSVFAEQGLRVAIAANGAKGLELLATYPDVVVLDIDMPGLEGFETLLEIRKTTSVPVLLLAAQTRRGITVRGLEFGADDFIPKPFNPDELVARVKSMLRRVALDRGQASPEQRPYVLGDLTIDLSQRLATVGGSAVALTRTEWTLLTVLIRNAGRVMLYEDLLIRAWGEKYRNDLQYLRGWISRLRAKLGDGRSTHLIRTVTGVGYTVPESEKS